MEITDFVNLIAGQILAVFIVLVLMYFLVFMLWPWVTKVYIPEKREHERAIIDAQIRIASALENAAVALEAFAISRKGDG